MPKNRSKCIWLSSVVTDPVFKLSKHYYAQAFLKEWKYKIKEKEKKWFKGSSDDDFEEEEEEEDKEVNFKENS